MGADSMADAYNRFMDLVDANNNRFSVPQSNLQMAPVHNTAQNIKAGYADAMQPFQIDAYMGGDQGALMELAQNNPELAKILMTQEQQNYGRQAATQKKQESSQQQQTIAMLADAFQKGDMEAGGLLAAYSPEVYKQIVTQQNNVMTNQSRGQITPYQQAQLDIQRQNLDLSKDQFAAGLTKPQAGFQYQEDGTMTYIPGGSADPKYLQEKSIAQNAGKAGTIVYDPTTGNPIVQMGGGNAMTSQTKAQTEQGFIQNIKTISSLEDIQSQYKPEYLQYMGKGYATIASQAGKFGLSTEEQDAYLADYDKFHSNIKEMFNAYRKEITGAGASNQELKDLQKSTLNGEIAPAQFVSRINNMYYKALKAAAMNKRFLEQGINPDGKEAGIAKDKALSSIPSDDRGKIKELVDLGYSAEQAVDAVVNMEKWSI